MLQNNSKKVRGIYIQRRIVFSVKAPVGSKVFVAGSFNGWKPDEIELFDRNNEGVFSRRKLLKPGTYQYKLIVNGVWQLDDNNAEVVTNDQNSMNNVLVVE